VPVTLVIAVGLWIALAGVALALLLHDDDPPQDADLRPQRDTISEDENAFPVFERAIAALSLPGRDPAYTSFWDLTPEEQDREDRPPAEKELYERMTDGEAWDDALAAKVLARNAEALAQWQEGMARPRLQAPEVRTLYGGLPDVDGWLQLANLLYVVGEARRKAGDVDGALDLAVQTMRFGHRIQADANCLLTWLVGLTVSGMGRTRLMDVAREHPLPADRLRALAADVAPYAPSAAGLANDYRAEYVILADAVDKVHSGEVKPFSTCEVDHVPSPLERFLWRIVHPPVFKPNRTKRLFAQRLGPMIETAGRPYKDVPRHDWEARKGDIITLIGSGNAVGRFLAIVSSRPAYVYTSAELRCAADLEHAAARLRLAARAYELEKGRPPPSLEALVPGYLDAVPADPFDGKPLRYDPARRLVWSVGKDLVDEGADFTFEALLAEKRKERGLECRDDDPESWDEDEHLFFRRDLPDPSYSLDIRAPFP
jgi:hypothetical protein